MTTLPELLGAANNLNEPMPVLNRQPVIIGLLSGAAALVWICVSLRLYTRLYILKAQGWDDLLVVLAACSITMGDTCLCVATKYGLGQHILLISSDNLVKYLQLFWIANATYPSSTAFIKLALLLQFGRVYEKRSRWWWCVTIIAVLTAVWGLAYSILAWVPCVPVSGYWDFGAAATRYGYGSLDAATFINTYKSHTAVNMALDVIVLLLAVPMFWQEGLRTKSYWGLAGLLVLGVVVNMLSIWRLAVIINNQATTYPTFDPTWYSPTINILSALEVDTAAICASLPVFWPTISKQINQIFVTHEVKITREYRRPFSIATNTEDEENGSPFGDDFDDNKHLNRKFSDTTTMTGSTGSRYAKGDKRDSYVMKQVVPFDDDLTLRREADFGKPTAETRVQALAESDGKKGRFGGV